MGFQIHLQLLPKKKKKLAVHPYFSHIHNSKLLPNKFKSPHQLYCYQITSHLFHKKENTPHLHPQVPLFILRGTIVIGDYMLEEAT